MRRNRRGGGSGLEFGGSGEDSFVAVVVTKLTGALLFILLLTMVIMALLPKAVDMAPPGGDDVRAGAEAPPAAAGDHHSGIASRGHCRAALRCRPGRHGGTRAAALDARRHAAGGPELRRLPRESCRERRARELPSRSRWPSGSATEPRSPPHRPGSWSTRATARWSLPHGGSPAMPPVPWRAWLDQGVGFLVLWLIHLVGMNTLGNLERTTSERRRLFSTPRCRRAGSPPPVGFRHLPYPVSPEHLLAMLALGFWLWAAR